MRAAFILFIAIADALRIGPSITARASSVATGARGQAAAMVAVADLDGPPTPRRIALAKIAAEEAEQRKKLIVQRGSKAFGIIGLSAACLAVAGPSLPLLCKVFLCTLLCTASGLYDGHLAVSYGYGLSLLLQACIFLPRAPPTLASRLLLSAYALYGVKVCAFQGLRDRDPDYVAKALEPRRREQQKKQGVPAVGFSAARLPLVVGVAVLLTTFAFPLHASVVAASLGAAVPLIGVVGGLVALAGLVFQTIADAQKFALKRMSGADALCRTGLWSLSRHPNYLGEIVFQIGVFLSGVGGALASGSLRLAASRTFLSLLAPLTFASIMLASTRSLEERQLKAYGEEINYREWVRVTPRLFIGIVSGRAALATLAERARRWRTRISAVASGEELEDELEEEVVPPQVVVEDTTREAIVAAETKEELGEEIWNITAVTGLAGISAWILGVAGSALFF